MDSGFLPDGKGGWAITIRQSLLGILFDKGVGLGPKCGGQHPAGAVTGNLGQWIRDRSGLVQAG